MECRPVGEREYVATGRGARLTYLLVLWGSMTIDKAAELLECSERNVYYIVDSASLAGVPVTIEDRTITLYMDLADRPY